MIMRKEEEIDDETDFEVKSNEETDSENGGDFERVRSMNSDKYRNKGKNEKHLENEMEGMVRVVARVISKRMVRVVTT